MGKILSIDSLKNLIDNTYKTKKVTAKGIDILIDQKFKPSKIEDMGRDFLEIYFYLSAKKIQVNLANLVNYFILKHFSSIGSVIEGEVTSRLVTAEDQSEENLLDIRMLCNLQICTNLVDAGLFEEVLSKFPAEEIEKVYKIHSFTAEKLQEMVKENSLKIEKEDEING